MHFITKVGGRSVGSNGSYPGSNSSCQLLSILQQLVKGPPPFRAVPIPWIVAKAMVGLAWRAGHHDVAVLILVGFCYFLRTMEFVTLPVANVVVDLATSQIVVSLDRAKTSEQYQQSLLLRHRTLARILSHALPRLSGRQRLWAASARDFRKCFTCLVEHLGLQDGFFAL